LPVVVGGTGLYLEAVLRGYRMVEAPEDPALRAELAEASDEALTERLRALKPDLHNTTDLADRERLVRAIEIAEYTRDHEPEPTPPLHPFVFGVRWPRTMVHRRIALRLHARFDAGLIEEVESLHAAGHSWERLESLGLEYRFIAQYLQDEIKNRNDLFQKLNAAIAQFAKRQETWFRRMERQGTEIHWVERGDFNIALSILREV
jgi:tRNA dimethylallyltransferase